MYIQVEVETPKNLTRRQRELLEEFERESHKETSPESSGFFAKMKEFFEGPASDNSVRRRAFQPSETPMPHATKLLFFAGSAREGSLNKRLARLGADDRRGERPAATFADLGDYPMPIYDADLEAKSGIPENAMKLEALMKVHAGIFIACPEYNASITPLLKNSLDWVSRIKIEGEPPLAVFKSRVFALGSASPAIGGMRGLLATVRTVLELGLGALVLPDQFAVPRAAEAYDEHGHLKNKDAAGELKGLIQKLARAAQLLHG